MRQKILIAARRAAQPAHRDSRRAVLGPRRQRRARVESVRAFARRRREDGRLQLARARSRRAGVLARGHSQGRPHRRPRFRREPPQHAEAAVARRGVRDASSRKTTSTSARTRSLRRCTCNERHRDARSRFSGGRSSNSSPPTNLRPPTCRCAARSSASSRFSSRPACS